MSKKKLIEALLAGYIEGRLGPEEKIRFFDLLTDGSNETIFRELLMKSIYASSEGQPGSGTEPDFSRIYSRIIEDIDIKDLEEAEFKSHRRKSVFRRLIINISAAAAVFAFAFISGRDIGPE